MHSFPRPVVPAVAALLCCTVGALAQTFSGAGPARVFAMPPASTPATPPVGEVGLPLVAASEAPTRATLPLELRRPPSVPESLRLTGENAEIVWPFYVTEAEARAGGRFQVGYVSAISVLPDVSTMTLSVNGTQAASVAVDASKGLRQAVFEIAPGRLVHGWNALRLAVVQRHRVDCSVEATYELWSQIDGQTTGFLPAAGPVIGEPADLAAIALAADGAALIRLVQAARMPERAVERMLAALQEAALLGHLAQAAVDFGPAERGGGLNLAVGTAETLGPVLGSDTLGAVDRPRLALLPATPDRRPTLVATGRTEAEVDEALTALGRLRAVSPAGTEAGLRALADMGGHRLDGGERVSLADLGLGDAHVTGRLHRVSFDLALPHDFLPADYAKIVLDLVGHYGPGLAPGAKIIVEINGRNAASTDLGRSRGETMTHRSVFMPLGLMRPGFNRITLSALLPRAEDATCATREGAEDERLFLSAQTAITVPPLARVGRQPDLAQTFAAGFPYSTAARRPTLLVPAPDRETMAAAATLMARLAIVAGKPVPVAFSAGKGAAEGGAPGSATTFGPTLAVSPAAALDPALLTQAGLDPAVLRKAWSGERLAPVAPPLATPSRSTVLDVRSVSARRRLLQNDGIAACGGRGAGQADDGFVKAEPDPVHASAVVAQAVTGPGIDDVLTLVTAPSGRALDEAIDCLVHPRVWPLAQGRLAALSAGDDPGGNLLHSWAAETPRFVATEPSSLSNLRRIAAGWLSLHAGFYGLFALLLAACLAVSTHSLVTNLGRRSS